MITPKLKLITLKYLIVIKFVWCFGFLGICIASNAQDNSCTNTISSTKCVTIDVSESMASIDKKFEIHWQLDDGTGAIGPIVKHCFEKFGNHTAQMNLKDTETGLVYENEYTANIFINPPAGLELRISDSTVMGLPMAVDYHLSGDYAVEKVRWSIDGEALSHEEVKIYQFLRPGKAQVELVLDLTFDEQPYAICAQKEVTIYGANMVMETLEDFYHQQGETKSRFLQAPYFISVSDNNEPALSKTIEVQKEGYYYEAKPHTTYELWSWHGNSFSEKINVSTEGLDQLGAQLAFDAALGRLIQTTPKSLAPVFHKFDETRLEEASKEVMEQNLALLKEYQNCDVLIGSYTHTGGFLRSNLNLSKKRSELVRKYLMTAGLPTNRVAAADPLEEKELINSCGFVGCEGEDASLNRRTDFKLVISGKR